MILFAILVAACVFYWFLLPYAQSWVLPTAPGGLQGPWVIRPIVAIHACAMAALACLTVPLVSLPLRRIWNRRDHEVGTQYTPFRGRPVKFVGLLLAGVFLLLLYSAALVFYLFSWTVVGPEGIGERLPWGFKNYAYTDIVLLETIPPGMHSESIAQDGPWYCVELKGGREIKLSLDNEGLAETELRAIAAFVAERCRMTWQRRPDARVSQ